MIHFGRIGKVCESYLTAVAEQYNVLGHSPNNDPASVLQPLGAGLLFGFSK